MTVWLGLVTTTSSWRRRKTRHSGEPPGGVVRSGNSTRPRSETKKKVGNPKKERIKDQRRSIWKGGFVDAFLFRMKKNRESLLSRKIWSRRSSISPEFVDCSVLIYNGKTPVRCKITEGKVGHKFGEFASTRRRRPYRTNRGKGKKGSSKDKATYGTKGNPIS
ncbi:Ribosomal protein S19, mitochondrial, partial [Ananas comosus]